MQIYMSLYVYPYISVYLYTCMHVDRHVYICMYIYTCITCVHAYTDYLLGTGESYGPTAQHMQDFPIFFIQLNYVYKERK